MNTVGQARQKQNYIDPADSDQQPVADAGVGAGGGPSRAKREALALRALTKHSESLFFTFTVY